jgi:hypothetical protein
MSLIYPYRDRKYLKPQPKRRTPAMSPWTHVVIHHSATPDTEGVETEGFRKYHKEARGWRDIGYHAVCERVGADWIVIAGRPLSWVGAHAIPRNRDGLGFCFAGNFDLTDPDSAMLAVGARHVAGWMDAFGMGPVESALERHSDVWQTACPGSRFPWDDFRILVTAWRGQR